MWWAIQLSLNYVFIVKFVSEKKFKNQWVLGEITDKKVDCPFRLEMSCLKTKNLPENVPTMDIKLLCSCITMQIIFDFYINKYQTDKYFSMTFWVVEICMQFAAVLKVWMDWTVMDGVQALLFKAGCRPPTSWTNAPWTASTQRPDTKWEVSIYTVKMAFKWRTNHRKFFIILVLKKIQNYA